ncbi:MAG: hypothetical protein HONBIEJF_00683 [Fimbriimonadaceae bacterium]|nr:hypothetical protein [Fimbriimonadaceae bacterium]
MGYGHKDLFACGLGDVGRATRVAKDFDIGPLQTTGKGLLDGFFGCPSTGNRFGIRTKRPLGWSEDSLDEARVTHRCPNSVDADNVGT